jgi:hypothetical protein
MSPKEIKKLKEQAAKHQANITIYESLAREQTSNSRDWWKKAAKSQSKLNKILAKLS